VDLADRVAVVTGASSGIGAAVAVDLARRGAQVVAVARRRDRLEKVAEACQACSSRSFAYPADISSTEACEGIVGATGERFGRMDILVNNAGISIHKHAARTSSDEVERLMTVNFLGAVRLTVAALPGMLKRREGSIVNVSSVAGHVPNAGEAAYGASKAALSRWSHGLAVDLHGTGVHVGVLSPGPIDTEIWGLDEEVSYTGKLYPPQVVADGVAKMIQKRLTHLTVPRRYGAVGALYPMLGRPMRWGLRQDEARAQKRRQQR
jgi:short-subunit dehydrogenase